MDPRTPPAAPRRYEIFEPKTDLVQEQAAITVLVYLPEFKKEQLRVQLTSSRVLRMSGERPFRVYDDDKWLPVLTGGDNGLDVCSMNEVHKYLNKKDVQKALRAKLVGVDKWIPCTSDIGYTEQDALVPTLPLVGKLVKGGVQVMVFSGDQDMGIPFMGTRILIKALAEELGLNTTVPYTSWLHNKQVGGWTQVYGDKLCFATVRGGGHDSTLVQPERTLALFNTFLQGKSLPVSPPPT